MVYSKLLSDRIRISLKQKKIAFIEKEMMGGLTFMVDDKMCVGIIMDELMARIDPDFQEEALKLKFCRMMDFTKRPMKGYVMISPDGIDLDEDLDFWINKSLEFNPKATSSKKKKKN
jgi:TfoX/Sxy family transcriptional regulator of competence genes